MKFVAYYLTNGEWDLIELIGTWILNPFGDVVIVAGDYRADAMDLWPGKSA